METKPLGSHSLPTSRLHSSPENYVRFHLVEFLSGDWTTQRSEAQTGRQADPSLSRFARRESLVRHHSQC